MPYPCRQVCACLPVNACPRVSVRARPDVTTYGRSHPSPLGAHKGRPYHDYSVNVVRHYHKRVRIDRREATRHFLPNP